MTLFVNQYRFLFFLSWIILYLLIPTWTLPISVTARAAVYFGLIIYFYFATYLLGRWANDSVVDKPIIAPINNWKELFRGHLWFVIICLIAAGLHIKPLFLPILLLGDETIHLQGGLWIYEYINSNWHAHFQFVFWIVVGLLIILKRLKICLLSKVFGDKSFNSTKYIGVVLLLSFFVAYFILLKDVAYYPTLIRYPPVSKLVYFLTYSAFGINQVFPRAIQLAFYLLSSLYLYRTIHLYSEKETALLGAALYLFLPITFAYAHLGELACGTIFFLIVISFYFLRFIKDEDNRDLLITAYLIGIGCLYKKLLLLMFIVCVIFFIAHKIKKHKKPSLIHLKILSLSMVPIIPWMVLTKYFSWRNYTFVLSNFTSFDSKIITYFSLMSSNISVAIFIAFLASVIYVCFFRRSTLTYYFGLLFIVYYFFIVSDMGGLSPRFSLAFYPTIIVFLSLFISTIIQNIKWRHAFKLCFIVLTIYLIIISSIAPLNDRFMTIMERKLLYFPSDKAMKWVKENVHDGEKVVTIRIMSSNFYRVKYGIDKDKIINFWYETKEISTPDKLRSFYKTNDVSYIMFPYSPLYPYSRHWSMLEYLKDNEDAQFIEVAKFNLDDNFIYIYKMKEI